MLADEGYLVTYQRIPITDEEAPEHKDLDQLVERIASEGSKIPYVAIYLLCLLTALHSAMYTTYFLFDNPAHLNWYSIAKWVVVVPQLP